MWRKKFLKQHKICREIFPGFSFSQVITKCLFSHMFSWKNIAILLPLIISGCFKQNAHPPVGGVLNQKDLSISQNRSKSLNEHERVQISEWIKNQDEKFYPMGLNYWVNKEDLEKNPKKADGQRISYQYELYDFDRVKLYEKPVLKNDVILGKFEDLKAVENIVRYLEPGDQVTLLVPSVLAFGTYGDNDKIPYDMPVIIKLKVAENQ